MNINLAIKQLRALYKNGIQSNHVLKRKDIYHLLVIKQTSNILFNVSLLGPKVRDGSCHRVLIG
jgi:hypothetical protein